LKVIKTEIPGVCVIEPQVFEDHRGFFFESFNEQKLLDQGLPKFNWIQDNHSKSQYGVIRGLHYQLDPFAQTKLVRVVQGSVIDIVVDIREGSPAFGKYFRIELTEQNKKQLLVPKGMAHGFSVISKTAEFLYKVDQVYDKASERSIHPVENELELDWGLPKELVTLGPKDADAPDFENCDRNFTYQPD